MCVVLKWFVAKFVKYLTPVLVKMNDNELFSSFMMLNEQLYDVFVQYILNGRCRAPPETELIEMLPTFQVGAKRDRRALQSKFKSWAKRMNFENGCLVLANTGKIIIPKEICDDLIMHMHLEKHTDLENIIHEVTYFYEIFLYFKQFENINTKYLLRNILCAFVCVLKLLFF